MADPAAEVAAAPSPQHAPPPPAALPSPQQAQPPPAAVPSPQQAPPPAAASPADVLEELLKPCRGDAPAFMASLQAIGCGLRGETQLDSEPTAAYANHLDEIGIQKASLTEGASTTLASLPLDTSRRVGHRSVEFANLATVMLTLMKQGAWREHDVVKTASLSDRGGDVYLIKFHYRAIAPHAIFYLFWRGQALPQAVLDMAMAVPLQHRGLMTRMRACAEGVGQTASLNKAVKLAWIDTVITLQEVGVDKAADL